MAENNFYDRYVAGEQITVWSEIIALGNRINDPLYQNDVMNVVNLMVKRIRTNLETIYENLQKSDYTFYNFGNMIYYEGPFIPATSDTPQKVKLLEDAYDGKLPLIFTQLFTEVERIDFRGYFLGFYEKILLDALLIYSPELIIELNKLPDGLFKEDDKECVMFTPDEYIKDDISGDIGYAVFLSEETVADSKLAFYKEDVTFVEYLRICFKWAGFPNLEWMDMDDIHTPILDKVVSIREKLLPI